MYIRYVPTALTATALLQLAQQRYSTTNLQADTQGVSGPEAVLLISVRTKCERWLYIHVYFSLQI